MGLVKPLLISAPVLPCCGHQLHSHHRHNRFLSIKVPEGDCDHGFKQDIELTKKITEERKQEAHA
jgi:hypothetical protein